MRKNDLFKNKTIPSFVKMISEVEKISLDEWNKDLNDEVISKSDPSSAAADFLAKMSADLTVKFLMPLFIPLVY